MANTSRCEQICMNTIGSYTCSCLPGYSLDMIGQENCNGEYPYIRLVILLSLPDIYIDYYSKHCLIVFCNVYYDMYVWGLKKVPHSTPINWLII